MLFFLSALSLLVTRSAAGCQQAVVMGGEDLCVLDFTEQNFTKCGLIDWSTTSREGTVASTNGLAIQPGTQQMYAIVSVTASNTERDLVKLSPTESYDSVVIEYIGNTGVVFAAIAFHCSGALIGVTGNSGSCKHCLYLIDLDDATTTLIADLEDSAIGNGLFYDYTDHHFYRLYGSDSAGGVVADRIDMKDTLANFPTSVGDFSTVQITRAFVTDMNGPIFENGIRAASFVGNDKAIIINKNNTVHVLNAADGTSTVLLAADLLELAGGLHKNPKGIYCLDEYVWEQTTEGDCTETVCETAVVMGGEDLCVLDFNLQNFTMCGVIDWSTTGRNGTVSATNGLAIQPTTQQMFAIVSVSATNTERDLVKLTPSESYDSVTIEYIGNTGVVFSAIAFHCTGALIGVSGNNGNCKHCLYLINLSDGSTTLIADLEDSTLGNGLFYDYTDHHFYRMYGDVSTTGGVIVDRINMKDTLDGYPAASYDFSTVEVTQAFTPDMNGPIYANGIQTASFVGDDMALVVNKDDQVHVLDITDGTSTVLLAADLLELAGGLHKNPKGIYCLDQKVWSQSTSGDCSTMMPTKSPTNMPTTKSPTKSPVDDTTDDDSATAVSGAVAALAAVTVAWL